MSRPTTSRPRSPASRSSGPPASSRSTPGGSWKPRPATASASSGPRTTDSRLAPARGRMATADHAAAATACLLTPRPVLLGQILLRHPQDQRANHLEVLVLRVLRTHLEHQLERSPVASN